MTSRGQSRINKKEIQKKINNTISFLLKNKYPVDEVQAQELIDYFSGEAPLGDTTTIDDILDSKWLLIHEIIEIAELKKMGFQISVQLLYNHPIEVSQAHLKATKYELNFASEANDSSWVKSRLVHVRSWLEATTLPNELLDQCQQILNRFS